MGNINSTKVKKVTHKISYFNLHHTVLVYQIKEEMGGSCSKLWRNGRKILFIRPFAKRIFIRPFQ